MPDYPVFGLCPLCNDSRLRRLTEGFCSFHFMQNIQVPTGAITINNAAEKLDTWYRQHVRLLTGRCWECGAIIVTSNYRIAKAAVAHVLPKEFFSSVETHPANYLELGAACGCHRKYDKSWNSAQQMKVFPLALLAFRQFQDAIAAAERRRIPACFL